MKKLLHILFFCYCLCNQQLNAQDSHLSQYFNMPVYVNPALAGNNIQNMRIAANYRSQWASSGTPFKTQTIGLDKIVNHVGFGVMISKNSAGKDGFNKLNLLGGISYHAKFGEDKQHKITAGFQVGLLQKSFDPSKLSFENQYSYDIGYDPNASSGETFANTKVSRPDVNFGITYYLGQGNPDIKLKPFAGLTFSHVNQPKESFIELNNVTPIKTTINGGIGIMCSKKLELKPMILYMKQDQFTELNAGIVSEFSLENTNTIKIGVFHRNKDAMIFYAGYQINKVLLGTSYDVNTSAYNKASNGNGAFEVSLIYTPQGKQAGKKIKKPEIKVTKPVNKKKLPEPKLKRPDFYSYSQPVDAKQLPQTANVLEPVKPEKVNASIVQLPDNVKAIQKTESEKIEAPLVKQSEKIISPVTKSVPGIATQPVAEKVITKVHEQNPEPVNALSNAEFEKLDFVLFKEYTTDFDVSNKFDVVESVIDFLYKYPSSKILLAGNTDDVEQRIKPALGMLRADEVKKYMINEGVDATRINLLNTKNLIPMSTGGNESPIELNRRVDIFLVK